MKYTYFVVEDMICKGHELLNYDLNYGVFFNITFKMIMF